MNTYKYKFKNQNIVLKEKVFAVHPSPLVQNTPVGKIVEKAV